MSANATLAAIFKQMADVMQILDEDHFRVLAFQKVARVLDDLSDDVASVAGDPPQAKPLTAIAGIGKGTADRIVEFLATGKIKEHEELLAKIPKGLPALLNIPSCGPKTVALMWKEAGVDSIETLKKKIADGSLVGLPGMGEKKVENLKKNLDFAASSGGRVRIGVAMPLAKWLAEQLKRLPQVKQVQPAGSLRRGKETIGDVDLVVAADPKDAHAITSAFLKLEPVAQVLGQGPTKASMRTKEGVQVDLRVVDPGVYGATLLYFTGSKEHNIKMRERAIKMGMKLNEYGLLKAGADENDKASWVAAKTEEDVYRALKLEWIPPELREDHGEVELAEQGKLPKLLTIGDIKAELHAHTTASDGKFSIRELAELAMDRGFHTIAVTDHSKSQVIANGLNEARLEAHIEAVRRVAEELKGKISVLAGSEVDILADGSLDYSNSILKELDIVIASPHAALSQDPAKATKRLLKAIDNPYVTILGHPTGRLVLRRDGLHPDMKSLIKEAKDRGVALEINANSYRLDLRDSHARAAIEAGVKLAIDTDTHGPGDLDELAYGVLTARRAGATAHDVVNCLSRDALAKWIKSTRK